METKRVVGIGGIFFKAKDPDKLKAWYKNHLGFDVNEWGGVEFEPTGPTVWSLFKEDSNYFAPSTQPFMINYRVNDLKAVLDQLRAEGCQVDAKITEDPSLGKFCWVMDPENNRIELWEPPKT